MDLTKLTDDELLALYNQPDPRADLPSANATAVAQRPSGVRGMSDDQLRAMAAMPEPERPGMLGAIGRGLTQGATLGYADELSGALGGAASWARGEGFRPGYERSRDDTRAKDLRAEQAHPWASTGGRLAGGVLATVPMVAAAPAAFGAGPLMSLGARFSAGARSGLGLGAVQGFGEGQGDLPDQGWSTLAGAGMGALTGLGATVIGAGAGAAIPAIREAAGSALPGYGRAASRDLVGAYEAAGPAEVRAALDRFGPEATLVDTGVPFLSRAQGIAAQPGAPGQRLVAGMKARNEGTNARLATEVDEAFGPALNPETVEAGFQGIRDRAGQGYGRATAEAGPVDTTDVLASLAQRLTTAEGGEKAALLRARDMLMTRSLDGVYHPKTDARNLHAIKESLDDLIRYGDTTIGVPQGSLSRQDGAVHGVRRALNDALEGQVPGYADANLSARTAHRASEALESGKRVLDAGENAIRPDSFTRAFEARPLEQQAALRTGVRSDLDRIVGTSGNDLQALRRQVMADGDWNRSKLATVFGEDEAGRVFNAVDREAAFRDAYNRVVNGSNTAKITEGVKATGVRPSGITPAGSDIALGGALGGHAGAATAAAIRGGRYGWNVVGRAMDRARNDQVGGALELRGPQLAELIRSMDTTLASRPTREAVTPRAAMIAQSIMQPLNDVLDTRERALMLARIVRQGVGAGR